MVVQSRHVTTVDLDFTQPRSLSTLAAAMIQSLHDNYNNLYSRTTALSEVNGHAEMDMDFFSLASDALQSSRSVTDTVMSSMETIDENDSKPIDPSAIWLDSSEPNLVLQGFEEQALHWCSPGIWGAADWPHQILVLPACVLPSKRL